MTLDEKKKLISRKYLGQAGIHGVGLARASSCVRVYMSIPDSGPTAEQTTVVEQLKHDAEPYDIDLKWASKTKAFS